MSTIALSGIQLLRAAIVALGLATTAEVANMKRGEMKDLYKEATGQKWKEETALPYIMTKTLVGAKGSIDEFKEYLKNPAPYVTEYGAIGSAIKATEHLDKTERDRLNDLANENAESGSMGASFRKWQNFYESLENSEAEMNRLNDLANENANNATKVEGIPNEELLEMFKKILQGETKVEKPDTIWDRFKENLKGQEVTGEIPNTKVEDQAGTTTPAPEQKPEEKDEIQMPGANIVEDKTNENIEQEVAQTWTLQDIIDFYKNQQSEQWAREDQIRKETQEREDTAYQRAVADMRKAGINPNLMNVTPADSGGGITQATGMDSSAITKQMENTSQELIAILDREFEGDENIKKQITSLIGELISSAAMIFAFKKKK